MNFVTIMNYDWSNINYRALCYLWVKQAETWLTKNDVCIIFSRNKLPKFLLETMKQSKTCTFKNAVHLGYNRKTYFPASMTGTKKTGENFTFKFYIICSLDFPFVFLDADALIMSPLTQLKEVHSSQTKPIIGIDHERDIPGHTEHLPPFLNSGVLLVRDPQKTVLNWDEIYAYGQKNRFLFHFKGSKTIIPGTDQAILKSYLDFINYDYSHEQIDYSYNCCATNLEWCKNLAGIWLVRKNKKDVNILHFWDQFKPWQKTYTPIFEEALNDKVLDSPALLE